MKKTAALAFALAAVLFTGCETYVETTRPAAVTTTRRHYVSYEDDQPYYRVYSREPSGRAYYRRVYYEDEPTYRVERRRYYYREPADDVSVRFGF